MAKSKEQHEYERELYENRLNEQETKQDYSWDEKGHREQCNDCGGNINSHGHCTKCDY